MDDSGTDNDALMQRLLDMRVSVLGYLRGLVRDSFLAEDVFQETCLTVMKRIGTFDRSRDFDAWVRGIARNQARNAVRKESRIKPLPSPELLEAIDQSYDAASAEEMEETRYMLGFLRECMARLGQTQRRMLTLFYNAGSSLSDIGREMAKSPGAVQVALHRVRSALLQCVSERRTNHAG